MAARRLRRATQIRPQREWGKSPQSHNLCAHRGRITKDAEVRASNGLNTHEPTLTPFMNVRYRPVHERSIQVSEAT